MTGAELIAQERARQVAQEGWTPDHDDEHIDGELVRAAQAYLLPNGGFPAAASWPFTDGFKPEGRIRNLVKAGALIAAEIDRLQRKTICGCLIIEDEDGNDAGTDMRGCQVHDADDDDEPACTSCGGGGTSSVTTPSSAWPRTSGASCVRAERAAERATQTIR